MLFSSRTRWIAGGLLVAALLALLAAIVRRGAPGVPGGELAAGQSETLHARVVEVVEEGMIRQGEFEQTYQRLRLRLGAGAWPGRKWRSSTGWWA